MRTVWYKRLALLGGLFLLMMSSKAKQLFLIDTSSYAQQEALLNSYLYLTKGSMENFVFSEIAKDLPVNHPYTLSVSIRNTIPDSVRRVLCFGERYIVVYQVHLKYSGRHPDKWIEGPVNSIEICLDQREELEVTFQVKELDRINPEKIAVRLFEPSALQRKIHRMYVTQSFFLGLLAFLCVFNLIIFFVTRWKLYLKYVFYIFSALVYFLYYYGFWQEWFPAMQQISVNLVYTWYSLIFISYFIFLNDFGNYKEYVPRAYYLLNVGIIFKSTETLLNTFLYFLKIDFIYNSFYVHSILVFEIILMGFILFYIIKNKSIEGRLIILASLFLISGAILEQVKIIRNIDPAYFAQLGIVFELLTFSAGLGYLTKRYYKEKRKNQHLYIQQLQENERIQKELNEKLEQKVKQRTMELEKEKQLVEIKNKENELLMMEIHHRVKNNLQMIVSLLNMQERSAENEEVRKALSSGKERIRAIETIHKMLYSSNEWQSLAMSEYISSLVHYCIDSYSLTHEQVGVTVEAESIAVDNTIAVPVGLILNELIVNSFKHAREDSQKLILTISLTVSQSDLLILFRDNGTGKQERLQKQGSLGMKIISILIKQLNGELNVQDQEGLEFRIRIRNYKSRGL